MGNLWGEIAKAALCTVSAGLAIFIASKFVGKHRRDSGMSEVLVITAICKLKNCKYRCGSRCTCEGKPVIVCDSFEPLVRVAKPDRSDRSDRSDNKTKEE